MEALLQEIETVLNGNGGSMLYSALLEALDYPKRQRAMDAIRYGKSLNRVKRTQPVDPENGLQPLRIEIVTSS